MLGLVRVILVVEYVNNAVGPDIIVIILLTSADGHPCRLAEQFGENGRILKIFTVREPDLTEQLPPVHFIAHENAVSSVIVKQNAHGFSGIAYDFLVCFTAALARRPLHGANRNADVLFLVHQAHQVLDIIRLYIIIRIDKANVSPAGNIQRGVSRV